MMNIVLPRLGAVRALGVRCQPIRQRGLMIRRFSSKGEVNRWEQIKDFFNQPYVLRPGHIFRLVPTGFKNQMWKSKEIVKQSVPTFFGVFTVLYTIALAGSFVVLKLGFLSVSDAHKMTSGVWREIKDSVGIKTLESSSDSSNSSETLEKTPNNSVLDKETGMVGTISLLRVVFNMTDIIGIPLFFISILSTAVLVRLNPNLVRFPKKTTIPKRVDIDETGIEREFRINYKSLMKDMRVKRGPWL